MCVISGAFVFILLILDVGLVIFANRFFGVNGIIVSVTGSLIFWVKVFGAMTNKENVK